MACGNVIYEKKFPHLSVDEGDHIYVESKETTSASIKQDTTNQTRKLFEKTVKILMPERLKGRDFFIDAAKCIAEFYEIDTAVIEYEDRLAASFRVDCNGLYSGIKGIIQLADDIGFRSDDGGVVLNVIYYTHATYLSGRKIAPTQEPIF